MNGFQWPAFIASVTLLIPKVFLYNLFLIEKAELGKYGGMNQAAPALTMLFAPAIGGV